MKLKLQIIKIKGTIELLQHGMLRQWWGKSKHLSGYLHLLYVRGSHTLYYFKHFAGRRNRETTTKI